MRTPTGTINRLLCDAREALLRSDSLVSFDPAIIKALEELKERRSGKVPRVSAAMINQAMKKTEFHRSQIQSFLYPDGSNPKWERHVIRDLTLEPGKQTLRTHGAWKEEYHQAHELCMEALEMRKNEVLANKINELLNEEAST